MKLVQSASLKSQIWNCCSLKNVGQVGKLAAVLTGIYLLRRKPLGYLLAPPLLVLCILNGLNVLAATASQTLAGIIFPPGVYVGMVGSWVVMGVFALWLAIAFYRSLAPAPAPRPKVAAA